MLSLPELSPTTLPTLLDRKVTSIHVDWLFDVPRGYPLTAAQPILQGDSDIGVNIEVFACWCVGWPRPRDSFAGRITDIWIRLGDTINVGQPILTAEVTSDVSAVEVIGAASQLVLHEALSRFWADPALGRSLGRSLRPQRRTPY